MPGADGSETCRGGAAGATASWTSGFAANHFRDGRSSRGRRNLGQFQELLGKPPQDCKQLGIPAHDRRPSGSRGRWREWRGLRSWHHLFECHDCSGRTGLSPDACSFARETPAHPATERLTAATRADRRNDTGTLRAAIGIGRIARITYRGKAAEKTITAGRRDGSTPTPVAGKSCAAMIGIELATGAGLWPCGPAFCD